MRANQSMPSAAVIPELGYRDVGEAAAWLARAFGFEERLRIGSHRIQMTWLGGAVVLTDGVGSPGSLLVRVPDVAAHHERAVAAGSGIAHPPTDFPYGERQYTAEDPEGHRWTFSETIEDVSPASWGGTLVAAEPDGGEPSPVGRPRLTAMAPRRLRIELEIDSDEDVGALRGALLAARGSERAEMQRRGARHAFGYGSDTAREGLTAEARQAERRWAMVDRLIAALGESTSE